MIVKKSVEKNLEPRFVPTTHPGLEKPRFLEEIFFRFLDFKKYFRVF